MFPLARVPWESWSLPPLIVSRAKVGSNRNIDSETLDLNLDATRFIVVSTFSNYMLTGVGYPDYEMATRFLFVPLVP